MKESFSEILEFLFTIDWSLMLNFVSVPVAIFYYGKQYSLQKKLRTENRTEELSLIKSKLDRISSIEHASRVGTYDYTKLVNEGVFSINIIDQIVSKCQKYNISSSELKDFERIANSALTNRDWSKHSAIRLIKAADTLKDTIY